MFQIHGVVMKSIFCLFLCHLKCGFKLFRCIDFPHAFSAAPKGCLNHDRVSDLLCQPFTFFCGIHGFLASRNHWYSCCNHGISGFLFIPQSGNRSGIRSNKRDVALFTKFCKPAVFRQKSKSWVNGIRSADDGCTDDALHIQIAFGRSCRPDTDGFICQFCVQRFSVCFRIHRHRLDPHFPACTYNTNRNLSAVGNEYFLHPTFPLFCISPP